MIDAIAMIIVAIISLIGIIIQTKSHNKLKTQEELLNTVDQKIEVLKKESKEDDQRLNERLDNIEMESCKRFLIVEMTKLSEDKYRPNEEQKRILKETKKIYNDHGGDSYVDDMYEDLREKKVI